MISLRVNGIEHARNLDPNLPLLWAIRDHLGLTGTKSDCGIAQCGACTAHLNGAPVRAYATPLSVAAGYDLITIEGLASGPLARASKAIQTAWQTIDVVQCGFCQSGQILAATALISNNPDPIDAEIDAAMSGNICRCATYARIRSAIRQAAGSLVQGGADA